MPRDGPMDSWFLKRENLLGQTKRSCQWTTFAGLFISSSFEPADPSVIRRAPSCRKDSHSKVKGCCSGQHLLILYKWVFFSILMKIYFKKSFMKYWPQNSNPKKNMQGKWYSSNFPKVPPTGKWRKVGEEWSFSKSVWQMRREKAKDEGQTF